MMLHFENQEPKVSIESFIEKVFFSYKEKWISRLGSPHHKKSLDQLINSMEYSLLGGGKRFRPLLCVSMGRALGVKEADVLPFAVAVEMVHTYSLIHDDLPSMDNDDFRRGQPTNHRKFGEDLALLAGDALLTESFLFLVDSYRDDAPLARDLVEILARAAGLQGMVTGQVLDLKMKTTEGTAQDLIELHRLKTGALIQACVSGACRIANVEDQRQHYFLKFAEDMGLAFQVADDILDADRETESHKSFVGLLGVEKTKEFLKELSSTCYKNLNEGFKEMNSSQEYIKILEEFVQINENRKI
ncbi:MAG TPA: polyprenyl synthetase family protein [Pseudobdellovibrionaceae bacterium]|nr:polyprenyl synthetase family protein [Pseudobdellovibrionaceae bacterium]